MAATLPVDYNVVLTLTPDLNVTELLVPTIDALVTLPDYPIVFQYDATELVGPPGQPGAPGSPGPPGGVGPVGPPGQGYTWRGAWNNATAYNPYDNVSNGGSSYVCIVGNINQAPPNTSYWNIIAQIGATGATGAQGPVGNTGATGTAATIAVGTTSTLAPGSPATVSNSGSTSAAVFNFGIPAGQTGATGAQGPIGNTGPIGQGYTWRGAWSNATAYNPYDTVSSAGSSYVCVAANTNQQPPNVTYWNLIAQIGATGDTGPQGPPGSSAVSANANNKATLGSDSLVLVQGVAAGVAATAHAQTVSGDDPQLTNARTPTTHAATHVTGGNDIIVPASASSAGLLKQLSGNTTDFVDGTNNCQNLVSAITPTITSVRLRTWNAVSNPGFEVDQRNTGTQLSNPASLTFVADRWRLAKTGTMVISTQQVASGAGLIVPGTNFRISANYLLCTLNTQASLAAGDYWTIQQFVEGPMCRELHEDTSSISLLVQSNVAPLKFGVALRDSSFVYNITKLCTINTPSQWILISLPIPMFPSAGSFPVAPGSTGYQIFITLACGTNNTSGANDVWNTTGGYFGALGQDNFASKAVGSVFMFGFIQHESGSPTQLIDKPFTVSYDEALRFYQKSNPYGTKPGTVDTTGMVYMYAPAGQHPIGPIFFAKPMAKVPTITGYNPNSGAANSVRDYTAAVDRAIAGATYTGDKLFDGFSLTTPNASLSAQGFHWVADTGM